MTNPGDIAIISLRADNDDNFSFVVLADIPGGTVIKFTDNGVFDDGTFRSNEGTLAWTAPAAGVNAGSVISFGPNSDQFTGAGGSFALSASGDQIVAYTGEDDAPAFIYALHSEGTQFQANATSSNTSALPAGLVFGDTAMAFGSSATSEFDNIWYTGPTSGTPASIRAAIGDPTNWTGSNSTDGFPEDPADFSVDGSGGSDEDGEIVISEIMYNPASSEDDWEWIEITNTGSATVDLAGWVLDDANSVFHTAATIAAGSVAAGQSAILYNSDDITAADFEAAWGTGITLIAVSDWSANGFNNGGDTVALWSSFEAYSGDETTFANAEAVVAYDDGGDWPSDDNSASIYLTDLAADANDGMNWARSVDAGATPVNEGETSNAAGGNSGADVGSPGGEDVIIDPPLTMVKIHEIQGSGSSSQLSGQVVSIQAVVTADFQDGLLGSMGDLDGFFVQEEAIDYDADVTTSEGIFIYEGSSALVDVAIGNLVTIEGTVSEFNGKTQITATNVFVDQLEVVIPDATTIEFGEGLVPDLEAVEGMLVNLPSVVVTEMFNLDRFGEIRVSDERFAQFTQNNAPDADANAAYLADIANRTITLDDGRTEQNPFEIRIPDGDDYRLTSADEFRMGDTLNNVTGVMDYGFGSYRIQAPEAEHVKSNPRQDAPDELGGNFKVASLNVLNYFTTLNDGSGDQTSVGQGPRGANTEEELARQTTKVVNAIVGMDADVVGLIEIENDVSSAPLKALVAAVNAELGSEIYGLIDTGQVGGDAITNAVIYKLATANPVGVTDILDADGFVDPLDSPRDGLNRPAVTQSFEHIESGEIVTVSVNHLKSKGSLSGLDEDIATGDGQGNNNATRAAAADVLADHLATNPTGVSEGNVLIIGDLNAYAQEDPLSVLSDAGYADIAYDALGEDAYSYVFDGQTGTLDYVLGSQEILDNVVGVTEWHVNSDEADALDYQVEIRNQGGTFTFGTRDESIFDGATATRNSDHDPVIVAFNFEGEPELNLVLGTDGRDRLNGTDGDDRIISLGGRYDRMNGGEGSDQFVFGSETRNDAKERDLIQDFDMENDSIVLSEGTEIASIFGGGRTLLIRFEGDGDLLHIRGTDLEANSLNIVIEDSVLDLS